MSLPTPLIAIELIRLDYPKAKQGLSTRALLNLNAAKLYLASQSIPVQNLSMTEIASWLCNIWSSYYLEDHVDLSEDSLLAFQHSEHFASAHVFCVSHETLEKDKQCLENSKELLRKRFQSSIFFEDNTIGNTGESFNIFDWATLQKPILEHQSEKIRSQLNAAMNFFQDNKKTSTIEKNPLQNELF